MRNYVSGHEYTGQNAEVLESLGFEEGDAFVTFKQAIKIPGMSGAKMKGLKADARLMRLVEKKGADEDQTRKMVPFYFSVFHVGEILKRAKS